MVKDTIMIKETQMIKDTQDQRHTQDQRDTQGEVGGWGRVPFSRNSMSPTPRRKWYLTTGRRAHQMELDPIPQILPVHFFGSDPSPPPLHS